MSADLAINLGSAGDAWSRIEIDPDTCALAQRAAARAGLSVEEWLEQAIRRSSQSRSGAPGALVPAQPAAENESKPADADAIVMPEALLVPLEDEGAETAAETQAGPAAAKPFHRWAGRMLGAALAVAAGVVSAQYLIPDRGAAVHVAISPPPPKTIAPLPEHPAAPPAPPPRAVEAPAENALSATASAAPAPSERVTEMATSAPAAGAAGTPPPPAATAPSDKPATAERKPAAAKPQQQAALPQAAKPPAKPARSETQAPNDPKQLAPWLETRAENGDAVATYRLGVLYALGEGVTQDYERAANLFKSAAEDGVTEAEYNIAVMYAEGLGIERDPAQAVLWYRKAAAQGSSSAAFNLGVAYSNGVGVKQDMAEAAQWFRKAGEAGVVNAQFNLGLLYERGEGLAASPVEAYAWYSAAAARGDGGAAQRRDRLAGTLSPAVLRDAQARAAQVQASIQANTTASLAPAGESTPTP